MLHPSYSDLMAVVNSDIEEGEQPVVQSRYSIVIATAKRARQIIDGAETMARVPSNKPLSIAVEELYEGKVKIIGADEEPEEFTMDYGNEVLELNLSEEANLGEDEEYDEDSDEEDAYDEESDDDYDDEDSEDEE